MNVQRIPEYLLRWGVTIGGIVLALFLAKSLGDGNKGLVAGILVGLIAIMVTLVARDRLWLIIPVAWGMSGSLPALKLPFVLKDLMILWVFTAFLTLKAFKVVLRQPKIRFADLLCVLMILYLIATFIRNPVGVDALASGRVGGRPYFNVFIGFLAYWVLSRSSLKPEQADRYTLFFMGGKMFDGILAVMLALIPSLFNFFAEYYHNPFFSTIEDPNASVVAMPGMESTERLAYLVVIGPPVLLCLAAKYRFTDLLNPIAFWRPLLLALGSACVLLSGFRSTLVLCAWFFLVAGYFRSKWREVLQIGIVGAVLLLILVVGNGTFFELPRSAQRALSWLPGKWDEYATLEAKQSTRWRTEMWKEMLTTDRYIESRWFGDGFGFNQRELQRITAKRQLKAAATQDDFMVVGAVHSGPVSTIRSFGYIGLALHLLILGTLARYAWVLCRKTLPTRYRLLGLVTCVPIIIEPWNFVFIFGAIENSIPESLFALGMLKMLQNSIEDSANDLSSIPSLAALPDGADASRMVAGKRLTAA